MKKSVVFGNFEDYLADEIRKDPSLKKNLEKARKELEYESSIYEKVPQSIWNKLTDDEMETLMDVLLEIAPTPQKKEEEV